MKIKSYDEVVKYLEGFIGKVRFEITPEFLKHHDPLERMRVLLSLLGNPQEKFKSVLVGGTSGKGSTAYLISHILTTAGYKTGLTISPHLQKINERLQINEKSISDEKFTKMVSSMVQIIELMSKKPVGAPSYFEILIAMVFLYFAKEHVDIAVVEVGMGGEYDATNTLYPLVAVLTNVSLDHTNVLGGTVQKIAKTKAGIIKFARGPVAPSSHPMSSVAGSLRALDGTPSSRATPRLVVVTEVKQSSVIKIVEDRCKKVGAKLSRLNKDFDFRIKKESLEGSLFDFYSSSEGMHQTVRPESRSLPDEKVLDYTSFRSNNNIRFLSLSLLGKYQVENASLAIETVRQLADFGLKVSVDDIRKALKTAFFPGRFEIVSVIGSPLSVVGNKSIGYQSVSLETEEQKTGKLEAENRKQKTENRISHTLILDGAHNPTKMRAFLSTLKKLYPKQKKVFVVGFKFDKDIQKMLRQITKVADKIIVTEFDRATDMSVFASAEAGSIKYKVSSIKYKGKIYYEESSKRALNKAFKIAKKDDLVVITGSLYLVGEIRYML